MIREGKQSITIKLNIMRRVITLLLLCCLGGVARAQTTANGYTWSQSNSTYTAISGATSAIASGWNDNVVSGIDVGFTFNYMGSNYTTVSVSSNGWIAFGSVTLTTTTYTGISTLGGGTNGVVCAASMNLQDAASGGSAITYTTTGSSPNRVFTIQWTNCRFSAGAESLNFQIKLYETSNIISVVYGTWATSGSTRTMQVGIRGTAVTDYSTRTTTTNWSATTQGAQTSTMTRTTAINPASGLTYSWCPSGALPSVSVSPTSGCSSYSATASGASTYSWSPATALSATTGSSVSVSGSAGSIYSVAGLSSNGCSSSAYTTAQTFTPIATANRTTVCAGDTTMLNAYIDSTYAVLAGTYSLTPTTGFATATSGDDASASISIPFTFNFFGTNYTSVNACTNGHINFGAGTNTGYPGAALPNTTQPTSVISLFCHDMNTGTVLYGTIGSAPNRIFVIDWTSYGDFSGTGVNTGQIKLYETTNVIECHVSRTTGTSAYLKVCGIQNARRTIGYNAPGRNGVVYHFNTSGEAWRFVPYQGQSVSYSWAPSAGLSSATSSSPIATVSATTTYTLTATIGSCTYTTTKTITANPLPSLSISPSAGCYGVAMTATGASTYSWAPATGLSSTNTAATTPTPGSATTYTLTGTSAAGCVSTTTKTVNLLPTVSVSPTSGSYCVGGTAVSLTASGTDSYAWSPSGTLSAATGASVNATPSSNTTYTVTGTDATTGCSNRATTAIASNAALGGIMPYVASDTVICYPGYSLMLELGGTGGTWSTSDAGIATMDASGSVYPVSPGGVTLYYTNACGSDSLRVRVASGGFTLSVTPSTATYCSSGSPVTMTVSSSDAGTDTWLWTDISGGAPIGLSTASSATVTATPSVTATYAIFGTNSSSGCHSSTTATITNNTPAAIAGGTTSICYPSGTTTWTDATSGGTWSSSNTSVATVDATTGVITATGVGSATIAYTVSATGCYVTRNITVNGLPSISATPSTAVACGGTAVSITASGATTYSWAPSTGLSATTGATVTANPASTTTYTISGTSSGCTATLNKTVSVVATGFTATVTATPSSICPGSSTTLTSATSANNYNVASVSYALESFTSSGSVTGDDVYSGVITIPFTFNYFGTNYTGINISTDGWVSFTHTGTTLPAGYTNYGCPTASLQGEIGAGIAFGVHDLLASGSMITYGTNGTAPNRKFIVYFNALADYSGGGSETGQIILYETSNIIDIMIGSITHPSYASTVGLQSNTGTVGIAPPGRSAMAAGTTVSTSEGWRFTMPPTSPTYSWAPSATVATSTASSTSATPSSTTTYTLTITDTSSGCIATASTPVTVYTAPTLAISPSVVCAGSSMTAGGAVTYSWSPATDLSATTGATVVPTPSSAATYTVTGIDSHGCIGTASTTVNIPPTVSVTPTTGCSPQTLTASGATTYSWTPSGSLSAATGSSVTASPSGSAVTYTVTGTDGVGCTATATANVGPAPSGISGTTTVCVTLTTALSSDVAGGSWTSSNTSIATVDATTGVVTGVGAGTCDITYTVGTCSPIYTSVTVLTSPALSVTATGCAPSATLVASGASTYSWSPSATLDVSTGSTVSASPSVVTVYTVTGSNGSCAVTATSTVYPTPASITGTTTVCQGSNTTLADATAGGAWSSSNTSIATVDATTGVVRGVSGGTVTISYGYSACASSSATTTVTVNSLPSTTYTGTSNCTSSGVSLTLSYAGGGGTYSWAPSTYLSATTGSSVTCTPTTSTTYTITATGTGGCTSTTTLPISVVASTPETPTATPSSTCSGGTSTLAATVPYSGYSLSTISYSFVSQTSPSAGPSGDDVSSTATIPFTFNYYGTNYTTISMCTNGFCQFGGTATSYPAATFPSTTIPGAIALFWADDWMGSPGAITYSTEGTAPNRKFVIRYAGCSPCCSYTGGLDGEIILYETTNVIDILVSSQTSTANHTCGINNLTGTAAVCPSGRNNASYTISTPEAYRFTPVSFTYAWSPATSLSATTGTSVTLTSAPGAGTYTVTATDAGSGCFFTGSTTVSVGAISVAVTNPVSVCSGATGTWTFVGPASGTVYYNIGGGSTTSVALNSSGIGTVTATISASTTLNLVSVTSGSCSNSLTGSYTIIPYCVCTPQYYYYTILGSGYPASTYAMNAVSIPSGYGSTSLSDAFTPTAAGYVDRTSVTPIQMMQSLTYSGTVTYSASSMYYENQIWIDFDDDGTFASSEAVTSVFGLGGCTTARTNDAFSLTIPLTATTGSHRMRVRNAMTYACTNDASMSPCAYNTTNYYYYGSCADYQVTIVALPACSGTPTPGTAAASVSSGCSGYSSTMSVTGATAASSMNYQWQYSTDGSSYSDISGATSTTYAATVSNPNEYYRRVMTCTVSSLSATSSAILVHATPAITGSVNVCQTGTTTLSDGLAGGTWSSSATGTATVNSSTGVVTGVAAGAVTISYATTGCTQTYGMNVLGVPASITGATSVCRTFTTTLANTVSGGAWSSSDTTKATVGSSTGVVTGVTTGAVTITYSTGCGTAATYSFTVNTQPSAITGVASICTLSTTTLADTFSGGTWTISSTTIGTIGSSSGLFSSSSTTGTATVTYTIGSCYATRLQSVGTTSPASITGTTSACIGATSTLADAIAGGLWSSSNTAIASVDATTGVVTAVSNGSATITYDNGCGSVTTSWTSNGTAVTLGYSSGSLSSPAAVCSGGTLNLTSGTTSGGTYSWTGPNSFSSTSQNPTISSVTPLASGAYTFSATVGGCSTGNQTMFVAVDAVPTVTATASSSTLCSGGSTSLSSSVSSPATGSYVLNAIPYSFTTLTSPTTGPTTDDATSTITLPFTFNFYGVNYSTLYLCSNAWMSFVTSSTNLTNYALPSTSAPLASINVGMKDMNPASGGSITYQTFGTTPNRRFVVSYNGEAAFSGSGSVTCQVILYETTNIVDMMISQSNAISSGGNASRTFGIQNAAGTSALTLVGQNAQDNQIAVAQGWRFEQPVYSYTWTPSTFLSATTGTPVAATSMTTTTTYSVTAVDAYSGCTSGGVGTRTITVNPNPTAYAVTGGGAYCSVPGTGVNVGLGGSETGVNYTWTNGSGSTGTISGTGSSLDFGSITPVGTYTVSAANATTGCTSSMTGSASVTMNTSPTAYNVTGGTGCSSTGVTMGVDNSQSGVSYQLYNGGSTSGSAVAGTGSAISFGSISAVGTYTVMATGTGGCTTAMTGSDTVNASPTAYAVTGGTACSDIGVDVGVFGSESGVSYQLKLDGSPVGSPLSGTGSALDFGVQTTPGTYTVEASASGCNTTMTGSAVVNTTPSVSLGANPSVCLPASGGTTASISYSITGGSPTTYSISWSSAAITDGFSNVSGSSLSGGFIGMSVPSTALGSYSGSITVSNGSCTSAVYTFSVTVYAYPTAAITSVTVPCVGDATSITITGTSGATISYNVDGGTVSTATLTGGTYVINYSPTDTTHIWGLISVANAVCTTYVDSADTIVPTPMQWIGGTVGMESDWNTATNWSCGYVPTASNDVTVPSGTTYSPAIAASASGYSKSLTIASGASVSLGSGSALSVVGNLSNNGTVSGSGTLTMNGSTAQTVSGVGSIRNFDVNNTSGVTVTAASQVTIKATLSVTSGSLATGDSVILDADSTTTARVATLPSGSTISGQVRVFAYFGSGRRAYRFWAHPFNGDLPLSQVQNYIDVTGPGGSTNGFTTTGANAASAFRYYTYGGNSGLASDPGWRQFASALGTPDSNLLKRYMGIRIFYRGAKGEGLGYPPYTVISATKVAQWGTLNQGDQNITMAKGSANPNQMYNMIGNPYASPVDIGTVVYNAKVAGNVNGTAFYVWNPYLGTAGQFVPITIGTGAASPYYLQASMCFQVKAQVDASQLNFHETNKSATASTNLLKALPDNISLFVYDANNHPYDMTYVRFDDRATTGTDNDYDATKAIGGANDVYFYSLSSDNEKMSIDARPFKENSVVPLGFHSDYAQDYIIKVEGSAVPEGSSVYLHDRLLDQYTQVKTGAEYRFSVTNDTKTQGENRFELTMTAGSAKGLQVNVTPNPASDDVKITFNAAKKNNVSIRVTDLTGVSIFSKDLGATQTGTVVVPMSNFASGVYIVELTSGKEKVSQKLIKE